jgi:GT2 family glycosyltransferase
VPRFSISIVTHNSATTIDSCLAAVYAQEYRDFSVTVIDNGSTDDTLAHLDRWSHHGFRLMTMGRNLYYARAHNIGIRESDSDFVLTLNPDVVMRPDYLGEVARAFELSTTIGSVNGKLLLLLSPPASLEEVLALRPSDMVIDGAGLMMLRSRRPFLRCYRQPAASHCLQPCYIFGVDGACAAFRRAMLEDTAIDGEYFDEDFVIYREDVDLAWRAQLYGWDSYYVPTALAYHVRGFHLGQSRRSIPAYIKRQSVKNGWLLVIKNDTPRDLVQTAPMFVLYQAKILAGLLTIEQSSLRAVADTIALLPRMRQKRRTIQSRRIRSRDDMQAWFT